MTDPSLHGGEELAGVRVADFSAVVAGPYATRLMARFGADVVTTVWVGRDDFKSLGYREYGGKAALPIWIDYMRVALDGRPVAANDPPEGMVKVAVGPGGRLLPAGSSGITEWVKAEDLDRMEADADTAEQPESQDEAAFDIF